MRFEKKFGNYRLFKQRDTAPTPITPCGGEMIYPIPNTTNIQITIIKRLEIGCWNLFVSWLLVIEYWILVYW